MGKILINVNTLEIHILSCKKDLEMLNNCISSFRSFDYFKNTPFFIHDDGTLNNTVFGENVTLIKKSDADQQIKELISGHPNCEQYRLGDLYHHFSIKLFDFLLLSKTKNILCLDTDVLCLNNPTHVIDLINKGVGFYINDLKPCYSFNHPELYPVLDRMNTGMFHIPSEEYYNIDVIENCLHDYVSNNGKTPWKQWVEQSTYSHMFKMDGNYVPLPQELYGIPYEDKQYDGAHVLHFVSGYNIRKKYTHYLIPKKTS